MESVSFRLSVAGTATFAISAVVHCTLLHAGLQGTVQWSFEEHAVPTEF